MAAAIVFCSDPLEPRQPDETFQREAASAAMLGFQRFLIDHDALDHNHNAAMATKRVRPDTSVNSVYRGWMMRAEDYRALYDALNAKGASLINTPEQYAACHHAPESYPHIASWAAETHWVPADCIDDADAIAKALAPFGTRSVVLKDWVKSQAAGYWNEACFVPDASNLEQASRVIARFRELQGESLVGGLVFRAYVPLNQIGGQAEEWRAFVLDSRVIGCWPRQGGSSTEPPLALLDAVAASLPSRFATVDFARQVDGGWLLLETGDGQVSELPAAAESEAILKPLQAALDRD